MVMSITFAVYSLKDPISIAAGDGGIEDPISIAAGDWGIENPISIAAVDGGIDDNGLNFFSFRMN